MAYELKEITDATRRFIAKELAEHVIGCKNFFRVLDVNNRERPRIVGDIYLGKLEFNAGREYPGLYTNEIVTLVKLLDKVNIEVYGHRITSERRPKAEDIREDFTSHEEARHDLEADDLDEWETRRPKKGGTK